MYLVHVHIIMSLITKKTQSQSLNLDLKRRKIRKCEFTEQNVIWFEPTQQCVECFCFWKCCVCVFGVFCRHIYFYHFPYGCSSTDNHRLEWTQWRCSQCKTYWRTGEHQTIAWTIWISDAWAFIVGNKFNWFVFCWINLCASKM